MQRPESLIAMPLLDGWRKGAEPVIFEFRMDDPARQLILQTRPKRENYQSEEDFEEALSRWMSRQGRSPVLRNSDSPQPSRSDSPQPSIMTGSDAVAPNDAAQSVAGSAEQHEDSRKRYDAMKSHEPPEDVERPIGWKANPVVAELLRQGQIPTADLYKAIAYPDWDPDDLPAELEADVRRMFPEEYESSE